MVAVAVVSVTVINSGLPSDDQTIVVGLRNADNGARIDGNSSTVSIVIMAHDFVAGLISFNLTNITVTEGENMFICLISILMTAEWLIVDFVFVTTRRLAKRGICRRRVSVCVSVCLSVCLCVRHTPVLYQNG